MQQKPEVSVCRSCFAWAGDLGFCGAFVLGFRAKPQEANRRIKVLRVHQSRSAGHRCLQGIKGRVVCDRSRGTGGRQHGPVDV